MPQIWPTGPDMAIGDMSIKSCQHLQSAGADKRPNTPDGCQECLETGENWVRLRLCLACGHVGCCDQSKNKHATRHFHNTSHPVIKSFEPGENWKWCYVDKLYEE